MKRETEYFVVFNFKMEKCHFNLIVVYSKEPSKQYTQRKQGKQFNKYRLIMVENDNSGRAFYTYLKKKRLKVKIFVNKYFKILFLHGNLKFSN